MMTTREPYSSSTSFEELTMQEVADATGVPLQTAYSRPRAARELVYDAVRRQQLQEKLKRASDPPRIANLEGNQPAEVEMVRGASDLKNSASRSRPCRRCRMPTRGADRAHRAGGAAFPALWPGTTAAVLSTVFLVSKKHRVVPRGCAICKGHLSCPRCTRKQRFSGTVNRRPQRPCREHECEKPRSARTVWKRSGIPRRRQLAIWLSAGALPSRNGARASPHNPP